jgi:hypothetical protein
VSPKLDRFMVRVLATFQLMVSVLGFFAFLFALNYGGAAANLGVLPLMFVYFLYGFVSALFLYSTLTFTRILALVWYAVFLIPVGLAWVFATKPVNMTPGFPIVFFLSALGSLYLGVTSIAQFRKNHRFIDQRQI